MAMYGYVWLYAVIYNIWLYVVIYTTCGYMLGNDHLLTEMYFQVSPSQEERIVFQSPCGRVDWLVGR